MTTLLLFLESYQGSRVNFGNGPAPSDEGRGVVDTGEVASDSGCSDPLEYVYHKSHDLH